MTMVASDGTLAGTHVGELRLRRFRAGEIDGTERESVGRHADGCGQCRARLRAIDEEQRQFEREIPFERFAGGVERARRVPRERPRRMWTVASVALAAAAAFVVVARTDVWRTPAPAIDAVPTRAPGANRLKGPATDATIRIGGEGRPQRAVPPGARESLAAGERVRIGYRAQDARYVIALSIDERGEMTTLYAERGGGLRVGPAPATTFLPDSLEFTGRGLERIVLLAGEQPLDLAAVRTAAATAYRRAGGDLRAMATLGRDLPAAAAEFTWLLAKP